MRKQNELERYKNVKIVNILFLTHMKQKKNLQQKTNERVKKNIRIKTKQNKKNIGEKKKNKQHKEKGGTQTQKKSSCIITIN